MNTIGGLKNSPYKMGSIGLLQTMVQNENKMSQSTIGFLNSGTGKRESDEKKIVGSGVVKAEQEIIPKAEASVQKSKQEYALFLERIQGQTSEESAEEKALRERKWEYVQKLLALELTEADKKRMFDNKQICLDGDGSDTLTEQQIAYLRNKYDVRHMTEEDTYYFLCDLTEMNVFSSEDWAAALIGGITILPEDMNKLTISGEGKWGWMLDENGNVILVESKLRVQEEEEEDPELIKARIKGYTDDILLEAFGSEDRKEVSSPEDLQAEQTLKENMDGITEEMEAMMQCGIPINCEAYTNGKPNSHILMDAAICKHNFGLEIKGIQQAAYQAPEVAARLLPQYQKAYNACDKLLKIVDQVKR